MYKRAYNPHNKTEFQYFIDLHHGLEVEQRFDVLTHTFRLSTNYLDQDGEDCYVTNEKVFKDEDISFTMAFVAQVYADLQFMNKQSIQNYLEEGFLE